MTSTGPSFCSQCCRKLPWDAKFGIQDFDPGQPRIGMNIPQILKDINANGFCSHRVVIVSRIDNLPP
jgi:hypothetical protein